MSGATACEVVGAGAVWWLRSGALRVVVIPPLLPIGLRWLLAISGLPSGGPLPAVAVPPRPIDPWAVAYSAPETAPLFLILPATFLVILALTVSADRTAPGPASHVVGGDRDRLIP